MPVHVLKYLPRSDCFKAEIGGRPISSHIYDYDSFGVMISYHGVSIGVSPGLYRNLVSEEIDIIQLPHLFLFCRELNSKLPSTKEMAGFR